MRNLLYSKTVAWLALMVIIAVIVLTFSIRPVWWTFFDEFFAFMMIFCQLVALYIMKFNQFAGKKLQVCAAVFGVLTILSLIAEFIIYQVVYD